MKLVGLMLARNEDWIIGLSARVALQWVDHLVVVNHASTDRTFEILREIEAEHNENRITVVQTIDEGWPEMAHRQFALQAARKMEATHIAMIDADEVLTRNLWGQSIRDQVRMLGAGQVLFVPGYNLRHNRNQYHSNGLWANRRLSIAFKDSPELGWFGNQFHHREPMGAPLHAVDWRIGTPEGGILHYWGACNRRLKAKHALYKLVERIQFPEKPVEEIDFQYSQAIEPPPGETWEFAPVPEEWQPEPHLLEYLHLDSIPWQEAECKRLIDKYGWSRFEGLDLFGVVEKPKSNVVSMPNFDKRPTFSLCHTTARLPDGWKKAAQAWLDNCDDPSQVEYILSVDAGASTVNPAASADVVHLHSSFGSFSAIENPSRRCTVDGWNTAAKASTGKFLINVADDFFPCPHWDTAILNAVPNLEREYALDISTGGQPGLLPFSLLTRPLLDRLRRDFGYDGFFYPGYTSVYSDTEYSDLVRQLKVLIDAKHLKFEHAHPLFGKGEMDEVYRHVNDRELYSSGRMLYEQRLAQLKVRQQSRAHGPVIAVIMPGERFSTQWVGHVLKLQATFLMRGWNFLPVMGYCTNVYISRAVLAGEVVANSPVLPDLVLWLDDDNILEPEQFDLLLQDLNDHPELDGVAGWSWVQNSLSAEQWRISCGFFNDFDFPQAFSYQQLVSEGPVKRVDWTGFPVFLMRFEALKKAGSGAFAPIISPKHPWGFSGEDVSFSVRAQANGCKFAVDARVCLRHQKLGEAGPSDWELQKLKGDSELKKLAMA